MKKLLSKLFVPVIALQLMGIGYSSAQTGTWQAVTNLPPNSNYGVCLLLTDGTVICHNTNGGGSGYGWDRLTPDIHGSYVNGTWTSIASMNYDRLFFSSQVLPNGQVYVAGGEYGGGGYYGEVYDPVADVWNMCNALPGGWNISDGNSELLYDGTVLEGPQQGANWSYDILTWSPLTNNYTVMNSSIYNHDEAEWLKLPDSTVLFVGINTNTGNRYIPQTGNWVNDGTLPGMLYDPYGSEAGCALMLPNGKAIFFGATPYNAIYTPSGNISTPGTWASADSFPQIQGGYVGQPDASGAMMVNGHILLACSPIGTPINEFNQPCYFVEYDYVTNTFKQVMSPIPGQGGDSLSNSACYQTQMLDLPDGNVFVSVCETGGTSNIYYVYTPGSGPIPQGKPTINNITQQSCGFYKVTGKLFNGISEGAAYGDDWQASTNWPIVRLTDASGDVYYAKSSNWNRVGFVASAADHVADSLEDTAYFSTSLIPAGTYSVQVVVNGFASNPRTLPVFGASISLQTNDTCNGQSIGSATVLASNGAGPYTYAWAPGGGSSASVSNLTAGAYTVTVTDHGGCTATVMATITQPGTLFAFADSIRGARCNGQNNGQGQVNVGSGAWPFVYSWAPSGGTNYIATGLSAGTYTVTVTDHCGATTTVSETIGQPATLVVTGSGVNTTSNTFCNGQTRANIVGGTPGYNYLWSPGGATTATVTGQCAGTYCCTVTDANGCTASNCVTIVSTAGIDEVQGESEKVKVYPNPNNGKFTIQIGSYKPGEYIEVYNVLGQQVYAQSDIQTTFSIDISNQPNGIYLYRVVEKDGSLLGDGKVLVEK